MADTLPWLVVSVRDWLTLRVKSYSFLDAARQTLKSREAQGLKRWLDVAQTPTAPWQVFGHTKNPGTTAFGSERQGTRNTGTGVGWYVHEDFEQRATQDFGSKDGCASLCFCSNDYLGLANHPALIEAFKEGLDRYGVGSGASHLISGHFEAHAKLEEQCASLLNPFIPKCRALFFSTGYMANLAVVATLGSMNATLFCDELNHASLIDGARLAKGTRLIYPHVDCAALETALQNSSSPNRFIVTDAVFSMDGDLCPLPKLLQLAEQYDAGLVIDDAHGFGVLGERGLGSPAHWNVASERLIYIGTLGKAAGVGGAFVAAHESIIELFIQTARSYIYTTAAPPAMAHALQTSLKLITSKEGDARRAKLHQHIKTLQAALAQTNYSLLPTQTPIHALLLGSNEAALRLSQQLENQGIRITAIRPPTVPENAARLRITLSAAHSEDDLAQLIRSFTR